MFTPSCGSKILMATKLPTSHSEMKTLLSFARILLMPSSLRRKASFKMMPWTNWSPHSSVTVTRSHVEKRRELSRFKPRKVMATLTGKRKDQCWKYHIVDSIFPGLQWEKLYSSDQTVTLQPRKLCKCQRDSSERSVTTWIGNCSKNIVGKGLRAEIVFLPCLTKNSCWI